MSSKSAKNIGPLVTRSPEYERILGTATHATPQGVALTQAQTATPKKSREAEAVSDEAPAEAEAALQVQVPVSVRIAIDHLAAERRVSIRRIVLEALKAYGVKEITQAHIDKPRKPRS